jgi:hypothetical protein
MARQLTIGSLFNESLAYMRDRASSLVVPVALMSVLSIGMYSTGQSIDLKIGSGASNDEIIAAVTEVPFLASNFLYFLAYLFSFIYVVRDIFDVKYFKKKMSIGQRATVSLLKIPKCLIITGVYFFMVSIGLSFLFFPGLFLLWVFYYGVTLSIISDQFYDNFFGNSYKLVMENKGFSLIVIFLSIMAAFIIGIFSGLVVALFGQFGAIVSSISLALLNVVLAVIPTMGLIYMLERTSIEERIEPVIAHQESV